MVHLFEWKFEDIAQECERFLGPVGYAAVQVSPITENLVISGRPWFERYQTMSYKIQTRSGNEESFREMVGRCNAVGVRILVDVVLNHMTGEQIPAVGTAGSTASTSDLIYPAVPYGPEDFHKPCTIANYKNATEVRVCELSGLHDLDQSRENVRSAIVEFMNLCIDAGVAGFRIDAAKHIYPEDLKVIYARLNDLNTEHGYSPNSRAFIFHEIIDPSGEGVSKFDYTELGTVTDSTFGNILGMMFRNQRELKDLSDWGRNKSWGLLPSPDAVVMIDNHNNQREEGQTVLSHKLSKQYAMAVAFMLAHPYGHPRVMSSFTFKDFAQGPPADQDGNIISPAINSEGTCDNGWVCEHRWRVIKHMVGFRNIVKDIGLTKWWTNGKDQIAFSRWNIGFIAFNNSNRDMRQNLDTDLPPGQYCDIISGYLEAGQCTGKTIAVDKNGFINIEILKDAAIGAIAVHVGENAYAQEQNKQKGSQGEKSRKEGLLNGRKRTV
ncbi:alpha-amylase-like [Belonocnema kinseyi]|uniref:alpha-amylase-like n=1 Tax=Belonocnema kinseyi TaxID=2817044 RepID=UPI00143D2F10|nr:alpha-amylase-like [Belonocnema kinseyi]